jgi:hypothetical protein
MLQTSWELGFALCFSESRSLFTPCAIALPSRAKYR